jgi:hypothetical protein
MVYLEETDLIVDRSILLDQLVKHTLNIEIFVKKHEW